METTDRHESFLLEEARRLRRSARITWIVGTAFALFLIGYLSAIFFMVRTFFDADNAALLIASTIRENAPQVIADTEVALASRAPFLARQMTLTFLEAIPQLRETAIAQIDLAHQEMIPTLSREFQDVIRLYIRDHAEELRAITATSSPDVFAEEFTSELMASLAVELEAALQEQYDGRDFGYFKENSLLALQAMSEHLDGLVAGDTRMTRRERLQRRLLAAVTRRVIHHGDDL